MAIGLSLNPKNTRIQSVLAAVLPLANYLISVERLCFPNFRLGREDLALALTALESAESLARAQLNADPNDRGARYRHMMIRECNRAARLCYSSAIQGNVTVDLFALATEANPNASLRFFEQELTAIQKGTTPCTTIENPAQRCLSIEYVRSHTKLQERIKLLTRFGTRGAGAHLVQTPTVVQNHLFAISSDSIWVKVSVYPLLSSIRKNILIPKSVMPNGLPFTNPTAWLSHEDMAFDTILAYHA